MNQLRALNGLALLLALCWPLAQAQQLSLSGEGVYGPVTANETLVSIAQQFVGSNDKAQLHAAMQALYDANPEAFDENSPNLLRAGSRLRLPPQLAERPAATTPSHDLTLVEIDLILQELFPNRQLTNQQLPLPVNPPRLQTSAIPASTVSIDEQTATSPASIVALDALADETAALGQDSRSQPVSTGGQHYSLIVAILSSLSLLAAGFILLHLKSSLNRRSQRPSEAGPEQGRVTMPFDSAVQGVAAATTDSAIYACTAQHRYDTAVAAGDHATAGDICTAMVKQTVDPIQRERWQSRLVAQYLACQLPHVEALPTNVNKKTSVLEQLSALQPKAGAEAPTG